MMVDSFNCLEKLISEYGSLKSTVLRNRLFLETVDTSNHTIKIIFSEVALLTLSSLKINIFLVIVYLT